ncbi:MAG: hypothetical protein CMH68_08805, partial [Nisaea sp.]|nr:hypothetical protein [Nisaea sp.]
MHATWQVVYQKISRDREDKHMESPGYIILSRQTALQRELSIVANNIANVNT